MTWRRNIVHDVDNRSRKRSRSRWHGPLVAIIEGSKAETTSLALVEESRQRNRSCKQRFSPDIMFVSFLGSRKPRRIHFANDTVYLRRISKCNEMKFRRTRDYSKPISKINPKYQISINAITLRQTLKQTPIFGEILISS